MKTLSSILSGFKKPSTSDLSTLTEGKNINEKLPGDVLRLIFDQLSLRDLASASLVCRQWHALILSKSKEQLKQWIEFSEFIIKISKQDKYAEQILKIKERISSYRNIFDCTEYYIIDEDDLKIIENIRSILEQFESNDLKDLEECWKKQGGNSYGDLFHEAARVSKKKKEIKENNLSEAQIDELNILEIYKPLLHQWIKCIEYLIMYLDTEKHATQIAKLNEEIVRRRKYIENLDLKEILESVHNMRGEIFEILIDIELYDLEFLKKPSEKMKSFDYLFDTGLAEFYEALKQKQSWRKKLSMYLPINQIFSKLSMSNNNG